MTETTSPHQADTIARQTEVEEGFTSEENAVPYDENLLERARTQWMFGDWKSLCKLTREMLHRHPDRAKLALLWAAGELQLGKKEQAMSLLSLANEWGVDMKLLVQILIAGVHNSLGRTAIICKQKQRALQHFENAIAIGMEECEVNLFAQARAAEQMQQIDARRLGVMEFDVSIEFDKNVQYDQSISPMEILLLLSENEETKIKALDNLYLYMDKKFSPMHVPQLAFTSIVYEDRRYYFVHFASDYIPNKIAKAGKFYEQQFLDILALLYRDGVVLDCGANIGNHSIYFSGVMGAKVVAFEPQPYNNFFLNVNRKLNGLEDAIITRNVALSHETGRFNLAMAIEGNYGSFTSDIPYAEQIRGVQVIEKFEVNASTIDDDLGMSDIFVSLIKLDVEGMELSVLEGASKTILKNYPIIAVECFDKLSFQKIKKFLSVYGYFVLESANATPTFIFLTRNNINHMEILIKYLENTSISKFSANNSFNNM